MTCMTGRIKMNRLDDAEAAYAEAFGMAPPDHIHGNRHGGLDERARLVELATSSGAPLAESELGKRLVTLEGEYADRLGGTPKIGFLWYQDGEDSLADRVTILEECLQTGRRRLMVEYGEGDGFLEKDAVSRLCLGDRMRLWLDRDGKVLW